jgi:predicted nicotinamide N-methyase
MTRQQLALPGGALEILQPADAAELPDDRGAEWAPLVPYSEVLWRSGLELAREVAGAQLGGRRVIELGCGLAVPSLAAARGGATVLATDEDADALALVERNARANGLAVATARLDWHEPGEPGRFDLVLAADVLYERASVAPLLELLPRLADEVWLADPGRAPAAEFLERAEDCWAVESRASDGIGVHRLRSKP